MDADELLGIVEWMLGFAGLAGLLLVWWLDARNRELERRVRRLEVDAAILAPLAEALEQIAIDDLLWRVEEAAVPIAPKEEVPVEHA